MAAVWRHGRKPAAVALRSVPTRHSQGSAMGLQRSDGTARYSGSRSCLNGLIQCYRIIANNVTTSNRRFTKTFDTIMRIIYMGLLSHRSVDEKLFSGQRISDLFSIPANRMGSIMTGLGPINSLAMCSFKHHCYWYLVKADDGFSK